MSWKRISVSGRLRSAAKMASSRYQIVSWLPADETGSRRIDNKPRFSGSGRAVIFPRRQSRFTFGLGRATSLPSNLLRLTEGRHLFSDPELVLRSNLFVAVFAGAAVSKAECSL